MAFKEVDPIVESLSKAPAFDKEKTQAYLKQYGTGMTDDAYVDFAKRKGKTLQPPKPLNPEFLKTDYAKQNYGDAKTTYSDQYLNDDDFLTEFWNDLWEDILDYHKESVGDK